MRIAAIGDVHAGWTDLDTAQLDELRYDLVLFVGDLPDPLHLRTLAVARRIAKLKTRAVLVPGNHDGPGPLDILWEALGRRSGSAAAGRRIAARLDRLQDALGPVELGGWSNHEDAAHDVTVIVGRPLAMDGRRCSFSDALEARWGVGSLAASAERLRERIAEARGALVFAAHNGPAGLGTDARAPFALPGRGDLGDPDLRDAIDSARGADRRVLAVIAGHFHHDGLSRRWQGLDGDTLWVNAARSPRVFAKDGRTWRHHVRVDLRPAGSAIAHDILLPTR